MKRKSNLIRDHQGVAAVTIAIALFAIIGVASLAIDMGQMYTIRNELQNVADAAALAGVAQLVQDQGGQAVRDSSQATQAAMEVMQTQSQLQGQTAVPVEARNDVTLNFGVWDIYASRDQAWTNLGPTCASDSNANALRVTIKRETGTVYGPVTTLFGKALGIPTAQISATATAFLGYTAAAGTGTVTVPLAVPQEVLAGLQSKPDSWFARLFAPRQAQATSNSFTFKDMGSTTWYQDNLYKPLFDNTRAYLFVVNKNDSVPGTVINNLKKYYTSGGTPVRAMARGTQLYPLSEYQWASNIKSIFSAFKSAYNAKKDSQTGKWRVNVPVYSTTSPMAQRRQSFPWRLALNLLPGVGEAHACFKFWSQSYPGGNVPIYVDGFANVDISEVTYNSRCVTTGMPDQVNNPNSCRNTCSVNVDVPVDQSTVSPPGSLSGGPDNGHITPGGGSSVGAIAAIPRLVQ
jgi:Flp pilus assembly protein TadG